MVKASFSFEELAQPPTSKSIIDQYLASKPSKKLNASKSAKRVLNPNNHNRTCNGSIRGGTSRIKAATNSYVSLEESGDSPAFRRSNTKWHSRCIGVAKSRLLGSAKTASMMMSTDDRDTDTPHNKAQQRRRWDIRTPVSLTPGVNDARQTIKRRLFSARNIDATDTQRNTQNTIPRKRQRHQMSHEADRLTRAQETKPSLRSHTPSVFARKRSLSTSLDAVLEIRFSYTKPHYAWNTHTNTATSPSSPPPHGYVSDPPTIANTETVVQHPLQHDDCVDQPVTPTTHSTQPHTISLYCSYSKPKHGPNQHFGTTNADTSVAIDTNLMVAEGMLPLHQNQQTSTPWSFHPNQPDIGGQQTLQDCATSWNICVNSCKNSDSIPICGAPIIRSRDSVSIHDEKRRDGTIRALDGGMSLETMLIVLLTSKAGLVLRSTGVNKRSYILVPVSPMEGRLVPLPQDVNNNDDNDNNINDSLSQSVPSSADVQSVSTSPISKPLVTSSQSLSKTPPSSSSHTEDQTITCNNPSVSPTVSPKRDLPNTSMTYTNDCQPEHKEPTKNTTNKVNGTDRTIPWLTLLSEYRSCIKSSSDDPKPTTIAMDLFPCALRSLALRRVDDGESGANRPLNQHELTKMVLEHLLAMTQNDGLSSVSKTGVESKAMLLTRETLSNRIRNRNRKIDLPLATSENGDDEVKNTPEEEENKCLMKLIQLQVMIRMQLYAMQGKDEGNVERLKEIYSTALSQFVTDSVPKVREGKPKGKKKKRKRIKVSNEPRHDILSDICSILELVPFVLPSNASFSQFLTETVVTPFYSSTPRFVGDIADYFEIDLSSQNLDDGLDDDGDKGISIEGNVTEKERQSDDARVRLDSPVVTDEDNCANIKPSTDENNQQVLKNEEAKSSSRWETISARIGKLPSSPISTESKTDNKEDQSPLKKAVSLSTIPLFDKSIELKVRPNSQNPLLADGRGKYVGNHFSQKLINVSSMFHEVKMGNRSSPKKKKNSVTSSEKEGGSSTKKVAEVQAPILRRLDRAKLAPKRSVSVGKRIGKSDTLLLPTLRDSNNDDSNNDLDDFSPSHEFGRRSLNNPGSKFSRPRRGAASYAAEACLAMRNKK